MLPQQYCLRWRYHHSNLQTMFSQLLERQAFCDVTLACEGQTIKAHKIVLSACSTYFDTILSQYEEKDPILIMKDVKFVDIKGLVEFMYKGEINVDHCHLSTLLKTAEDLKIKGLAEVSWREDGMPQPEKAPTTVEPPKSIFVNKRKRGRPPMDDYDATANICAPQKIQMNEVNISHLEENTSTDVSNSDQDLSIWEEDHTLTETQDENENNEGDVRIKMEPPDDDMLLEEHHVEHVTHNDPAMDTATTANETPKPNQSMLMANLEKDWPDIVKMNEYLNTGRRQQFWEEPFTKRVMDGIKNKNLEMKIAAELLGVSYGTLYGRYRDAYGCLKHPYRVRDFWSEQGPIEVIQKLKRKELTLYRAAELLNVTPQTLSNYLVSMQMAEKDANSSMSMPNEEFDMSDREASLHENPPFSNHAKKSVLPNCPDVTIIKKEQFLGRINNNSDHPK